MLEKIQRYIVLIILTVFAGVFFGSLVSEALAVQLPPGIEPVAPQVKDITIGGQDAPVTSLGQTREQILEFGPRKIMDLILQLFTAAGVVITIIAGLTILFARGDQAKVKQGIMALIYTAIGMILIGSSWIIVRLILDINLGT